MNKNNLNLENYDVKILNFTEEKDINGGSILILAFIAGVGYGYVKEKFETDQW